MPNSNTIALLGVAFRLLNKWLRSLEKMRLMLSKFGSIGSARKASFARNLPPKGR